MTFIDDIVDNLDDVKFWDNSGFDYALSLSVFILSLLIFIIIKLSIKRQQKILLKTVEISRGERVLNLLNRSISWVLVFLISFYFSLSNLTLPENIQTNLSYVIFTVFAWYTLKFAFGIIDVGIDYQKSQEEDSVHILNFFRLFIRATVIIVVTIWYLSNIGINVNSLMAGFGILGLAVAFALQNIIADIFASLTIFLDRPFEIGDYITIGSDSGTVESIGIRSTKIRTSQGELLIISNRELTEERINNYKKMKERRIGFTIGVSKNTPVAKLKEIPGMIEKIIAKNKMARFNRVFFKTISDFSFIYDIVYYVTVSDYSVYVDLQQKINLSILEAFENEKIKLPYPTQKVIVDKR